MGSSLLSASMLLWTPDAFAAAAEALDCGDDGAAADAGVFGPASLVLRLAA